MHYGRAYNLRDASIAVILKAREPGFADGTPMSETASGMGLLWEKV